MGHRLAFQCPAMMERVSPGRLIAAAFRVFGLGVRTDDDEIFSRGGALPKLLRALSTAHGTALLALAATAPVLSLSVAAYEILGVGKALHGWSRCVVRLTAEALALVYYAHVYFRRDGYRNALRQMETAADEVCSAEGRNTYRTKMKRGVLVAGVLAGFAAAAHARVLSGGSTDADPRLKALQMTLKVHHGVWLFTIAPFNVFLDLFYVVLCDASNFLVGSIRYPSGPMVQAATVIRFPCMTSAGGASDLGKWIQNHRTVSHLVRTLDGVFGLLMFLSTTRHVVVFVLYAWAVARDGTSWERSDVVYVTTDVLLFLCKTMTASGVNEQEQRHCQLYLTQCSIDKAALTYGGFLTVNKGFLLMLAGTVLTYYFILLEAPSEVNQNNQ